jgi:hypothetical protein
MPIAEADALVAVRAAALAEHYQKTVELVSRSWDRRNRQFIILIAVLAAAVLVAFARQLIAPFLEAVIIGQLPGLPRDVLERLRVFLPLASDLLLALLVVSIFYLMASLTHATGMITNAYLYLSMMEAEIRRELQLAKDQVAFTREGPFFEATSQTLSQLIGLCYKIVLGVLLVAFFALRIYFDLPYEGALVPVPGREEAVRWYGSLVGHFLLFVDIVVAIPTLWLYARYTRLTAMAEADARRRIARLQG